MWRQRVQARAIREKMIRDLRARPPEPANKPETVPENDPVQRQPAGP